MERTYNYDSSSGAELRSVTISFNLQQRTAPDDIVESITNILLNGNISLNLSEDFRVLAFQPSCKCIVHVTLVYNVPVIRSRVKKLCHNALFQLCVYVTRFAKTWHNGAYKNLQYSTL